MAKAPPTKGDLLELWRRSTPDDYWRQIEGHPSEAVFRALAAEGATLGAQADRGVQARFILPHTLQRSPPASLGAPARGQVVVSRDGPLEFPLCLVPGALRFEARRGVRQYSNANTLMWWPGEGGPRTVELVCDVQGYVGNLDYMSNPDGSLDLDLLEVQRPEERGNSGGRVVAGGVLQDTGVPDVFGPEVVGRYLQIVQATVPSNVSYRRITGYDFPQVESPAGSGLYPRQVTVDPEQWARIPEPVLEDSTLATLTDYYPEAWTGSTPIPLFGVVPAVGDAFYFTSAGPFDGLAIELLTGEGDWGISWEYWDGATWSPLPDLADATLGWRAPGTRQVYWSRPNDWATLVSPLSGLAWYFVRARLSALTLVTTAPTFERVSTITLQRLAPDPSVDWQVLDFRDALGLTIVETPQAPTGGRDNDLYLLGDNRGIYRQAGEDQETFRQRVARLADVVSPNAIQRIVNRALEPLGLTGQAVDVSSKGADGVLQFPGFFFDLLPSDLPIVGAWDLYEPGDLYPEIPGMVLLDADEAWGWFFVLVPYSSLGDFGFGFDLGPSYTAGDGEVLVEAWDTGVLDGYPATYYSALAGMAGAIDAAKAGGVGWTLIRSELV